MIHGNTAAAVYAVVHSRGRYGEEMLLALCRNELPLFFIQCPFQVLYVLYLTVNTTDCFALCFNNVNEIYVFFIISNEIV